MPLIGMQIRGSETAQSLACSIALGDARVLAPGRWRWVRALVWMAVLLVIEIAILSLQSIVASLRPDPDLRLAMAFVCAILAYGAYALLVRAGEGRRATEVAVRPALRETSAGLVIGLAAMGVIIAILWLTGAYNISAGHWTDWTHDVREAIGTGLLEELLARLILFRLLMRAVGQTPALLLSALAFGAAHLGNDGATLMSSFAIAVEAGLMLAAFFIASGRIWLSVGVHAGWNLAQGGIFGAAVSGFPASGSLLKAVPVHTAPIWLSGGSFGPEASLVAVVVGFSIFLAVMRTRLWSEPARTEPS